MKKTITLLLITLCLSSIIAKAQKMTIFEKGTKSYGLKWDMRNKGATFTSSKWGKDNNEVMFQLGYQKPNVHYTPVIINNVAMDFINFNTFHMGVQWVSHYSKNKNSSVYAGLGLAALSNFTSSNTKEIKVNNNNNLYKIDYPINVRMGVNLPVGVHYYFNKYVTIGLENVFAVHVQFYDREIKYTLNDNNIYTVPMKNKAVLDLVNPMLFLKINFFQ